LVASTVLLVQQYVPGQAVATLPTDELDDTLLNDLWRQVSLLRRAHIAHRDLRLANVLVDDSRQPWLVDFGFAEAGAKDEHLDADVAELLTGLAAAVGPERAVRSSLTALKPAELARGVCCIRGGRGWAGCADASSLCLCVCSEVQLCGVSVPCVTNAEGGLM
jgi:serine/threonine protein kinase